MKAMNRNLEPKVRWRRRVAIALIAATAGLFLTWLSFPYWARWVAPVFLPEGWRLMALSTGRPGLRFLPVDHVRIEGVLPGFNLVLKGEGLRWALDGTQVKITDLALTLSADTDSNATVRVTGHGPEDATHRFSLPRLLRPGGLPHVQIGRLDWTLHVPGNSQSGRMQQLRFGSEADALTLETRLDPVPLMRDSGILKLRLQEHEVWLDLVRASTDGHRILFYRQVSLGHAPGEAAATLQVDLELSELDLPAVMPMMEAAGLPAIEQAGGTLRAGLQLQGRERLHPLALTMECEDISLASGEERLLIDWSVNAGLSDSAVQIEQAHLEAEIALSPERWRPMLESLTGGTRVDGLPETSALMSLSAGEWQARADLSSSALTAWDGALEGNMIMDGLQGRLVLRDGRMRRDADGSWSARAGMFSELHYSNTLSFAQGPQRVELDDTGISLEGSVSRSTTGAVSTSDGQVRMTADRVDIASPDLYLEASEALLEGALEWSEDSRFDGRLSARDAKAGEARSEPPLLITKYLSGTLGARLTEQPDLAGRLRFDGAGSPAMDLSLDVIEVGIERLSLPELEGELSILTTGMAFSVFGAPATGFDFDLVTEIREGVPARGKGELLLGYSASLPFTFRRSGASGNPVVELDQAALPVTALPVLVRALQPDWAEHLQPESGHLTVNGSIEWQAQAHGWNPQAVWSMNADGLDFCYAESCLRGLALSGDWVLEENLMGETSVSIAEIGLAAGLDLVNFSTQLSLSGTHEITLQPLSAMLLGGQLHSPMIGIRNAMLQTAVLDWAGVDLGQLFEFLDVDGLDGKGRIDARLPLSGEGDSIAISGGTFHSSAPGLIRYSTGVPASNIGMQALENFEYESLSGTVDYGADGRYDIRMTLNGHNPDLYGGHPVRFNLNLGGELPALFRTLFITGDFGQAILDRVKSGRMNETGQDG